MGTRIVQIRDSKLEIRNKSKTQNTKIQNNCRRRGGVPGFGHLDLSASDLFRISDFEFRASYFPEPAGAGVFRVSVI